MLPQIDAAELRTIVTLFIALLLSIALHEFGHAYVADRLGDSLPRHQGRVSLNPLAHADPLGTLVLPLLGLLWTAGNGIGFGWGKPVQVNPLAFTRRFRMRTGHMLVALAGPAMNVLFGAVLTVLLVVLGKHTSVDPEFQYMVVRAAHLNFVLAFFNLIPTAPLDGGYVLQGLLPDRLQPAYERYSRYGIFVLMAVMFIPQLQLFFVVPAMWVFTGWHSVCAAIF